MKIKAVLFVMILLILFAAAEGRGRFYTEGKIKVWAAFFSEEKDADEEEAGDRPPMVALTFDDGPSALYTGTLLDGLEKRGVKASFFLLGKNVEGNEKLVKRMWKEGHLVGNHTYSHVKLSTLSEPRAREEILKTNNQIYEITGSYPQYLRPPFGSWKKNLEFCVEMIPVFWNIDPLDWKIQNVPAIVESVLCEVRDGAIILMHDGYETSVEAALKIIDRLQADGYEFVTVDCLITP